MDKQRRDEILSHARDHVRWDGEPMMGGWYTEAEVEAVVRAIRESMDWTVGFGFFCDEIVAFWAVLLMLPERAPGWMAAAAFLLFRLFDIAKPAPIKRIDARIKNGFGVMIDDAVAAFYTLLVIAVYWRISRG